MNVVKNPKRDTWKKLLARPVFDASSLEENVKAILDEIKQNGDKAVKEYTKKFDSIELDDLRVFSKEMEDALYKVSDELKKAILLAKNNIESFHVFQLNNPMKIIESTPGVQCWQKAVPIEKVGLYVPGGTAPLFSTVLMLGIPAKIAGCKEIILCTPPNKEGKIDPAILVAANVIGIDQIFKVGGVQAIAAMAYGTDTIPGVYKIFGPGNQYVTTAKMLVSRDNVAIDMPAGPSEVLVMADETSNPEFIAYDLLSQAEHGTDSQAILVTNKEKIIPEVQKQLELKLKTLSRKEFAAKSLENSKIILIENEDDMLDLVNEYAPEHLIISMKNADDIATRIINAGSVFIGNNTPESAGDYASGTNHTLPTNGWAKSMSGVNMESYLKRITFQKISEYGLFNIGEAIEVMAATEGLDAHKNAVTVRLDAIKSKLNKEENV
ncbi:MAG: histidinol dehydrogenase [Bacteroidales bacterium]|nr:histidinol dehydrogenase [Bacteroidales bacterium]